MGHFDKAYAESPPSIAKRLHRREQRLLCGQHVRGGWNEETKAIVNGYLAWSEPLGSKYSGLVLITPGRTAVRENAGEIGP